ncbi:MAG: ABC transporter ATP-binding protein, partial [Elsteraceae bacterium]
MTAPAQAILEVSNIEVIYNKTVQVLRGLSLEVP